MPWIALTCLGLTIVFWRFTHHPPNDICRVLASILALVCLIIGLANTPLFLRSIMLLGLLIYPTCFSQLDLRQRPLCPRLCLFRRRCHPSLKQRLSPDRRY